MNSFILFTILRNVSEKAKLVSYAQNFEDIYIYTCYQKFHEKGLFQNDPSFIDIGAWEPVADSVSKLFIDLGWFGTLVEPIPLYATKLREAHSANTNVRIIEKAIAPIHVKKAKLYVPEVTTGWSSLSLEHSSKMKEEISTLSVSCMDLSSLLLEARPNLFFVKMDIEGYESEVLQDWNGLSGPALFVIEDNPWEPKVSTIESQLLKNGYKVFFCDGANYYFVKLEFIDIVNNLRPINSSDHGRFSITSNHFLNKLD